MTEPPPDEPDPTAAEDTPRPPSCADLNREAEERPKSLRLLPRITADALRIVWRAAPRPLLASIALKLANGVGVGFALIFSKNLIGSVLTAGDNPAPPP